MIKSLDLSKKRGSGKISNEEALAFIREMSEEDARYQLGLILMRVVDASSSVDVSKLSLVEVQQELLKRTASKLINDERTTPRWFFDALNAGFEFTLDAAANEWNALCEEWLTDALVDDWDGNVFINPPYSAGNLKLFIDRARKQSTRSAVQVIAFLLPADTSVNHFPFDADAICFLNKRLAFGAGDGAAEGRGAPFANAVAVFTRNDIQPRWIKALKGLGDGWFLDAGRPTLYGARIIKPRG